MKARSTVQIRSRIPVSQVTHASRESPTGTTWRKFVESWKPCLCCPKQSLQRRPTRDSAKASCEGWNGRTTQASRLTLIVDLEERGEPTEDAGQRGARSRDSAVSRHL